MNKDISDQGAQCQTEQSLNGDLEAGVGGNFLAADYEQSHQEADEGNAKTSQEPESPYLRFGEENLVLMVLIVVIVVFFFTEGH